MRVLSLVLLALAALLVARGSYGEEGVKAACTALEPRQGEFLAAMADGDAHAVAGYFSEDAVVQVAGRPPVSGREAIGEFYANLFRFLEESSVKPEVMHVSGNGEMGYSAGTTSNRFKGQQGSEAYAGKYLLVWRSRGGECQIVAYSVSSNTT